MNILKQIVQELNIQENYCSSQGYDGMLNAEKLAKLYPQNIKLVETDDSSCMSSYYLFYKEGKHFLLRGDGSCKESLRLKKIFLSIYDHTNFYIAHFYDKDLPKLPKNIPYFFRFFGLFEIESISENQRHLKKNFSINVKKIISYKIKEK